jgi:inhibitor of KinA sporulation pathway (predicted exonuclease)
LLFLCVEHTKTTNTASLSSRQFFQVHMAYRIDQIVVVDIESTCWEGETPPGQESEIIEIGICLLNAAEGQRSMKQSILVRPEQSQVSEFCTRLTTLTQKQVDQGISFSAACQRIQQDYKSRDRTWASYGDYDRVQFQRQCERTGIPYPFNRTHLNVKNLFALSLSLPREVGLDLALQLAGLPMEGTHHRGHDDAWNIAALLAYLLNRFRSEH